MKSPITRAGMAGLMYGLGTGAMAGNPEPDLQSELRDDPGLERIVVVAPRIVRERQSGQGRSEVTVVERRTFVDAFDLDLSQSADLGELENRIRQAATDVCHQLARDHPFGQPGTSECIRRAYDDTLAQVQARLESPPP